MIVDLSVFPIFRRQEPPLALQHRRKRHSAL